VGAVFWLLILPSAGAVQPRVEEREHDILRALFADGRLWLLTDSGALSSIPDRGEERRAEALPEPAHEFCLQESSLLVLTAPMKKAEQWTIRRRAGSAWTALGAVRTQGDGLVAMLCEPKKVTLLTSRRLVEWDGSRERSIPLAWERPSALVTSVHATQDALFVGFNAGEWGGGLRRIDRATGKIVTLERNASGRLCGGPLNTECDPVHAIADEPWKPGCVVAAIGLVHMRATGRLTEICGNAIERLYFKPFEEDGWSKPVAGPSGDDERGSSVAFFGLVRSGDALVAAGIDGLYKLSGKGAVEVTPLPAFKKIGGVGVSFDRPDVILVLTTINQHASVSGAVPMLVPR
jgi:hypothetical protein